MIAFICILCATIMACSGYDEWGWLLVVAVISIIFGRD